MRLTFFLAVALTLGSASPWEGIVFSDATDWAGLVTDLAELMGHGAWRATLPGASSEILTRPV